jgi:hypothetical protein
LALRVPAAVLGTGQKFSRHKVPTPKLRGGVIPIAFWPPAA